MMVSMPHIKPQVYFSVKRGLVESALNAINNPEMQKKNPVGETIKSALKRLKKTQGWLAEQCDVSDTAVSKWIASGKISRDKAIIAAGALQISMDVFLGPSENADPATKPQGLFLVYLDSDELALVTAYRESTAIGKSLIKAATTGAPRNASLDLVPTGNKH